MNLIRTWVHVVYLVKIYEPIPYICWTDSSGL